MACLSSVSRRSRSGCEERFAGSSRVFPGPHGRPDCRPLSAASIIPWDFVDLIDRDPARRVQLQIEQDRLSQMHPSDMADILEELAPAERQALFSSLDEEVAAEALEEVKPKMQQSLIESLDSEAGRRTSSKRWTPALPPTFSRSSPTSAPKPSSKRWTPRSGRRSKICSSSPETPPPAA